MSERRNGLEALLRMRNIEKYYGDVKALDRAEITLEKGEIHALIGANGAGKSTLMKVLCGELDYQAGEIEFDGEPFTPKAGRKLMERGIMMIRQELTVIPTLTVAQYIFAGREPTAGLCIDDRKMIADTRELLKPVEATFEPTALMRDLSIAEQQLVEIAKALSFRLKLLILDESTTALGEKEVKRIFTILRGLKEQGITVVYISHRLEELFAISDRITVMRDGRYIKTLDTAETSDGELIRLLVGRELKSAGKERAAAPDDAETVLEVRNLSTPLLKNVGFSLKKGEILGLAGLSGAGRSETARAICGIDPILAGEIFVNGKKTVIRSPKEAAEHGICYLSEDRNEEGYVPNRSIISNTVMSALGRYEKGLVLDDRKMLDDTVEYNRRLNTKYSDPHAPVTSLSGGNVQKVIIAKWLIRNPQIFIFDEPTKGIDVGAKDEIYRIIGDIVKEGHSVILISSETKELLNNCDRMVVLCEGRVTGEMTVEDVTNEKFMYYATGAKGGRQP